MKIRNIATVLALIGLTLANTASAQDSAVAASAYGISVYVETGATNPDLGIEESTAAAYCTLDVILYVLGMALCEDGNPEEKCDGEVVVFVLTDDQCQKSGSAGCSGKVGVFITSSGNCHGGEDEKGCEFLITIFDPTGNAGNCQGGGGAFRLFR